jgi:hypothetical protein
MDDLYFLLELEAAAVAAAAPVGDGDLAQCPKNYKAYTEKTADSCI